jgi:phosphoribosylanthranilate isomerase
MQIKICGITRKEDIRACENYDADLIGLINIKRSPRYMGIEKIRELSGFMNDKRSAVLVLEPKTVAEIEEKVKKSGIKTLQLHSLSSNDIVYIKGKYELRIIKAIGIQEKMDKDKEEEIKNFAKVSDFLLFDYEFLGKNGGTGKQISLEIALNAAKIARKSNPDIEIILAGGMNKERITREGRIINEYFGFVDVNSGVEDSPGIKNAQKISQFIESCRGKT